MPDTTPMPNTTAKIFFQCSNSVKYVASRVRSHCAFSTASQLASPMVKAGKIMWNEMVKANWIRASISALKLSNMEHLRICGIGPAGNPAGRIDQRVVVRRYGRNSSNPCGNSFSASALGIEVGMITLPPGTQSAGVAMRWLSPV